MTASVILLLLTLSLLQLSSVAFETIVEVQPLEVVDNVVIRAAEAPAPQPVNSHAPSHAPVPADPHTPARAHAHAHAHAHVHAPTRVPGPEEAFRSRCWKANFSPPDGHPVDHTPAAFVSAPTCRGRIYLLSIVHSAVGNRHKRDLIRSTWASVINVSGRRLATVFVVGRSASAAVDHQVQLESREFSDMVVADFLDSYRNLTYKNLYGIRWALEHCPGVRFVFKADDDVLMNPFQLMSYISDRFADARSLFYCRTARENKMTERWMKWFVTPDEWPEDVYPVHCKGLAYLFSADLLPGLHLCAKWRRYFWIDDIFVTGALGHALGATLLHWAPGWDFQYLHPRYTGRQVNEAILFNEYDSNPMPLLTRRAWRAMLAFST